MTTLPTAKDFVTEIERIKIDARSNGEQFVEIISGEVHKNIGGYPSNNHRMATCCTTMYSLMQPGDEIIEAPPKGKGAYLKIKYYL